jgi:hypothetical protein
MISVYHAINKQRELTPDESARLDEIIRRQTAALRTARYREQNKDLVNAKRRDWYQKNTERAKKAGREYTKAKSSILASKAKEWRARNPHKTKQYNDERRAREEAAKQSQE